MQNKGGEDVSLPVVLFLVAEGRVARLLPFGRSMVKWPRPGRFCFMRLEATLTSRVPASLRECHVVAMFPQLSVQHSFARLWLLGKLSASLKARWNLQNS